MKKKRLMTITIFILILIGLLLYGAKRYYTPMNNEQASCVLQPIVQLDEQVASVSTPAVPHQPEEDLNTFFHRSAPNLSRDVIEKVVTILSCAAKYDMDYHQILSVIDYSLPANAKRLWVFDLYERRLLFNTYVSHGIKSGAILSSFFSNKYNSKTSSIGVYQTDKTYYGRDGLSLRLNGLDTGFNDNAMNRSIVMHGGWYVEEKFIHKYGRAGRSWGCPALPLDLTSPIINTIKDKTLLVIYYPNEAWFEHSKFLRCALTSQPNHHAVVPLQPVKEEREPILYADLNKNNRHEENEPVLVVHAQQYAQIFQRQPPLDRMLRRQINTEEYIALTTHEWLTLVQQHPTFHDLFFVVPSIRMSRGYYLTEMKVLPYGPIKQIEAQHVSFEKRSQVSLKTTQQFIRWLGL